MNSSSYQLLGLFLSVLNYGFIFLLIFSALKVDYYNSIVKIFVKAYKPISKISLISNQLINVLFLAVLIKFVSLYLLYSNSYDSSVLILVEVIEISDKILMPLRQYIPSAGGLDFSPLFIFILIQFLSGFLNDLLRYVV